MINRNAEWHDETTAWERAVQASKGERRDRVSAAIRWLECAGMGQALIGVLVGFILGTLFWL